MPRLQMGSALTTTTFPTVERMPPKGLRRWFINASGEHVEQSMYRVEPNGLKTLKGVRTLLQERGLWKIMNLETARLLLSPQPDFAAQREWMTEVVEGARHIIDFYPKFHF